MGTIREEQKFRVFFYVWALIHLLFTQLRLPEGVVNIAIIVPSIDSSHPASSSSTCIVKTNKFKSYFEQSNPWFSIIQASWEREKKMFLPSLSSLLELPLYKTRNGWWRRSKKTNNEINLNFTSHCIIDALLRRKTKVFHRKDFLFLLKIFLCGFNFQINWRKNHLKLGRLKLWPDFIRGHHKIEGGISIHFRKGKKSAKIYPS